MELNRNWERPVVERTVMAPDADAVLTQNQIDGFTVCPCPYCDGTLKPDVTFFGDNVNTNIVEDCYNKGLINLQNFEVLFSGLNNFILF